MALNEYLARRHGTPTPESKDAGTRHRQPIFVVQEHYASRHHYDFRLEADGVLKSWAVPKRPSLDPTHKRLAIHVADHPLSYATFEGTIPEGAYGAGTVALWDHGTYENKLADRPTPQTVSEGIEAGQLDFVLHGDRLMGRFLLVRMSGVRSGKDNWLLIKVRDEHARSEEW